MASPMQTRVGAAEHNGQIFGSIISSIPVDVMDAFASVNRSPKKQFGDHTVLRSIAVLLGKRMTRHIKPSIASHEDLLQRATLPRLRDLAPVFRRNGMASAPPITPESLAQSLAARICHVLLLAEISSRNLGAFFIGMLSAFSPSHAIHYTGLLA